MKRILLVCSAGMSTSMLVKKMNDYCVNNNLDYDIEAKGMAEAKQELDSWDVILVGPQISFAFNDLKAATDKPVELIPAAIYAMAKGKETMELAMKLLGDK